MNPVEQPLVDLFSKFPVFPTDIKNVIRKVLPWILIVIGVFSILAWLVLIGISGLSIGLSAITSSMPRYLGDIGTYVIMPIQALLALAGGVFIFQGKKSGWDYAVYYEILSILIAILTFSIFSILWSFLWLWCIFQIREYFVDNDSSSIM